LCAQDTQKKETQRRERQRKDRDERKKDKIGVEDKQIDSWVLGSGTTSVWVCDGGVGVATTFRTTAKKRKTGGNRTGRAGEDEEGGEEGQGNED